MSNNDFKTHAHSGCFENFWGVTVIMATNVHVKKWGRSNFPAPQHFVVDRFARRAYMTLRVYTVRCMPEDNKRSCPGT